MDDDARAYNGRPMVKVTVFPEGFMLDMFPEEMDIPEVLEVGADLWLAPVGALVANGVREVLTAKDGYRVHLELVDDEVHLTVGDNPKRTTPAVAGGLVVTGTVTLMAH